MAIFHSHLIYANIIWSSGDSGLINAVFKLQKSAIRIIDNASYNQHTEPLFKKHKILPLPDLINFFKLQFMHRFKNKLLPVPTSFNQFWPLTNERLIGENQIQLRNINDFIIPPPRLALTKKLAFINLPGTWNKFPNSDIKSILPPPIFDHNLKKFYLDDLSADIHCNRLFCPT